MTDAIIRKNTKSTISYPKMEKEGASLPFLCTCGSNTRLKFQIETHKIEIERGIAVMLLVLIATFA